MGNQPGVPGMSFPDLSPPSLAPTGVAAPGATAGMTRAAAAPAAPQRTAAAPAPTAAAAAAEVVEAVAEPIDELLQQVTEQTLHLNHVEGALREVAKSITDLGDATQAGLVEVRGLVAHGGSRAAGGEGGDWQKAMGERIDELEAAAARSGRMQTALLAVAGLELAALLFVILLETGAVSFRKKSEEFSFAPPPAAAQPATGVASAPAPLPEPSAPPKDTRAKRRAKH